MLYKNKHHRAQFTFGDTRTRLARVPVARFIGYCHPTGQGWSVDDYKTSEVTSRQCPAVRSPAIRNPTVRCSAVRCPTARCLTVRYQSHASREVSHAVRYHMPLVYTCVDLSGVSCQASSRQVSNRHFFSRQEFSRQMFSRLVSSRLV